MASTKKEEQEKVAKLLKDAVPLLCRNGLTFTRHMKVQGLLGITLDDDEVFNVHLNETVQNPNALPDEPDPPSKSTTKRRRRHSSESGHTRLKLPKTEVIKIKTEPAMMITDEVTIHDSDSEDRAKSEEDGLGLAFRSSQSLENPGGTATNHSLSDSSAPSTSQSPGAGRLREETSKANHSRKLFIGGLSHETTEETLKGYFGKWGEITNCVIDRDPNTKISCGYGFIMYKRPFMVDNARYSGPHVIDNRKLIVKKRKFKTLSRIFCGGVKDDTELDHLRDYFSEFGNVQSVDFVIDTETGKKKAFACVSFEEPVHSIVLLKKHKINGHWCKVGKALSKLEKQYMKQHSGGRGGRMGTGRGGGRPMGGSGDIEFWGHKGGSGGNGGGCSSGGNWGNQGGGGGGNWGNHWGDEGGNWGNQRTGGEGNWGKQGGGRGRHYNKNQRKKMNKRKKMNL